MRGRVVAAFFLAGLHSLALGQATPAVTAATPVYNPGIVMPFIDGNFQYALTASELFQSGYYSGIGYTTNLGGDMEYTSKNEHAPTSVLYAAGYLYSDGYGSSTNSTYQSLTLSQGLIRGRWSLGIADAVSYMPNAPATGLSGVPGVGDLGQPVQQGSDVPAEAILTNYVRRVTNTVMGNVSYQLTSRTSISGTGSDGRLYFLDTYGLNTTQDSGSVSLNHQLDRRNTIGLSAGYTSFNYTDQDTNFQSRSLSGYYTRIWNRSITTTVSGGPAWISGFNSVSVPGQTAPVLGQIPSRVTFAGGAMLTYQHRFTTATVSFSRSVNGGSGYQVGAIGNAVSAGISRTYGREWSTSASASFSNTEGLGYVGTTNTFYGGVQVNRRFAQHFSVFASYTLEHQSLAASLFGTGAYNGTSNIGAIGITYAPRAARLGQF